MAESRLHERCACGSALSSTTSFSTSAGGSSRPFTLAGTRRVYERARPFTVRHIALDLALDIEEKAVAGSARLDVTRIDPAETLLALDALGFEIARVEIATTLTVSRPAAEKTAPAKSAKSATKSGKGSARAAKASAEPVFTMAEHTYDGESLRVHLPLDVQEASIRVTYRAVPRRGMYFLAPDEHVPDRPRQVWTQCQDEDARHIFPCIDKPHVKQTTEVRVRVPAGWTCLSNGELSNPAKEQKQGIFHYRLELPLHAGGGRAVADRGGGGPYPARLPRAARP